MKTQNKAQLIGYLGAEPKIFKTPTGEHYAIMRLATDRLISSDNEPVKRITSWHTIKCWGTSQMKYIRNNFMKGSHVLVEGSIEYYQNPNGTDKQGYLTEIKATTIINLDR